MQWNTQRLTLLIFLTSLIAIKTKAIPIISPDHSDITFSLFNNALLQCKNAMEITWYFENGTHLNAVNKKTNDNQFESNLSVNVTNKTTTEVVGYYYCAHKQDVESIQNDFCLDVSDTLLHLFDQGKASRIYGFLESSDVWHVESKPTIYGDYGENVIPCRPANKNVNVTLQLNDEDVTWHEFDPKEGFKINVTHYSFFCEFRCVFNGSQEYFVELINEPERDTPDIELGSAKYFHTSEKIELICTTMNPSLRVSWQLPSNLIAKKEECSMKSFELVKTLTIENTTQAVNGSYTCHTISNTKVVHSRSINVKVVDRECFVRIWRSENIVTFNYHHIRKRNDSVVISVHIDAHPVEPVQVMWIDNMNRTIANGTSKLSVSKGARISSLIIPRPVLTDMGNYQVRAFGQAAGCQDSKTIKFIVEANPVVAVDSQVVLIGQTANASCSVHGYPASTISWSWSECPLSKNWSDTAKCVERSIANQSEVIVENDTHQTSRFSFAPTVPGRLTCMANNTVHSSLSGQGIIYIVDRDTRNVKVDDAPLVGSEFELNCLVDAYNFTESLHWQRNGTKIVPIVGELKITRHDLKYTFKTTLQFKSIQGSDEGDYECVATNASNNASIALVKSVFVKALPSQQQASVFKSVELNKKLALSCYPTGMPLPSVTWWIRKTEQLRNGSNVIIRSWPLKANQHNHTLEVMEMNSSFAGLIQCRASNELGTSDYNYVVELKGNETSTKSPLLLISGLCLLLIIAILTGFFFWYREHKKCYMLKQAGITYFDNGDMSSYNTDISRMKQADLLPYDKNYEFPMDRLCLTAQKLGEGAFGVVYKATSIGIEPGTPETTVAVKTIKNKYKDEEFKALISELKIMIHMGKHVNVVNLVGAVTRSIRKRVLYVITEYCDKGNLYQYVQTNLDQFVNQVNLVSDEIDASILSNHDPSIASTNSSTILIEDSSNASAVCGPRETNYSNMSLPASECSNHLTPTITTTDLVCWSFQVARGMSYLSMRGVLHGDLAARNILLCSNNVVKICDFGLSRSLQPTEDYTKSNGLVPIKWLAIESLTNRIFNSCTDVWSFGILLWELFTLMEVPYANVTDDRLLDRLKSGYRMPQPRYSNRALYRIMADCWIEDPRQRPHFDELAQQLGAHLPSQMTQQFIDMNNKCIQSNIEEGRDPGDYLDGLMMSAQNTYAPSEAALQMLPLNRLSEGSQYSPLPTPDGYAKMYPILPLNV